MIGSAGSGLRRAVSALGAALVLLAGMVAWPEFTRSETIPFGSPAFASQWNAAEATAPNFWGPAIQPLLSEEYAESPSGIRQVQYFDKARMEQTQPDGVVTNGLLTVELVSGKRQLGDTLFATFVPSSQTIVGDLDNVWPPYSALTSEIFPKKVTRTGEPTGGVYQPDGTLALNPSLAADPGAAFGSWQRDPGGVYAHNIPHAFWAYLIALPVPWQTAMGYPLTEAFWVNVRLAGVPTWVMVQPYERRVLSYTPTNPDAFKVEMGNIGQHYYQWRYANPTATATGTLTATRGTTGTPSGTATGTARASGTPTSLAISNVQLGAVTDFSFALSFRTSIPATSLILYGTESHSYAQQQDIATSATMNHAITLTNLEPGTKYYFALRVTASEASIERKEDFFATTGTNDSTVATVTATNTVATATATHTATPTHTPTPSPTATNTRTPTATRTPVPTATHTPVPTATNTPTPSNTPIPPKNVRMSLASVTLGAANDTQLAPSVLSVSDGTVALSLSYDGPSGGTSTTVNLTNWSHDAANARMTGTGSSTPLALVDKQATISITATVTIPYVDRTMTAIVVSFTRKLTPGEYAAGSTIVSPPLNNAKNPRYSLTVSFTVTLV